MKKSKKHFFTCKTDIQWYFARSCMCMQTYAVSGKAYEVVRKPTTTSLYRINLVSSHSERVILSLLLSRLLSFDKSLTDYVVPHVYDGSRVQRCEDIRVSGEELNVESDCLTVMFVWLQRPFLLRAYCAHLLQNLI